MAIKFFFPLGQTGVFLELKIWYEHEIDVFVTCRFLGISVAVLFECLPNSSPAWEVWVYSSVSIGGGLGKHLCCVLLVVAKYEGNSDI